MKILIVTKYFAHRFKPKQKHVAYPHSSLLIGQNCDCRQFYKATTSLAVLLITSCCLQLYVCASSSNRKAGEYLNCCFTFIQTSSLEQFYLMVVLIVLVWLTVRRTLRNGLTEEERKHLATFIKGCWRERHATMISVIVVTFVLSCDL